MNLINKMMNISLKFHNGLQQIQHECKLGRIYATQHKKIFASDK